MIIKILLIQLKSNRRGDILIKSFGFFIPYEKFVIKERTLTLIEVILQSIQL